MKRFSFHQDRLETVESSRKVFDDPKRIRARRARAVVIALVTAVLCWAILFLDGSFSLQSALRELNPFYRDDRSHANLLLSRTSTRQASAAFPGSGHRAAPSAGGAA